ncbi:MAG: xanthine dehydrogenase family protein molybdopterin-binding subunit [Solirubrobacterales bacterium]|nr:xanthine dehydrogenase family protein molybdopterin-binding subunit [Solirubrobacterales bacterium]MBV9941004.1 xanthine dehydrogenase family protein molybdopterin-binding subunit [Solirubrobacterales bacterium]
MSVTVVGAIGAAIDRVEGRAKVTGEAKYAYEYRRDEVAYAAILQSTVAKGAVRAVDAASVLELPGVHAVLWHGNAPRLHEVSDGELEVLQSDRVSYRGQIVGAVLADSYETARQAERLVRIEYAQEPHDVLLHADHPKLYTPEKVNPNYPAVTSDGDFDAAFAAAEVKIDCTYETPSEHNNPMEPHATLAVWEENGVTLYDSNQGVVNVKNTVARAFGLEPDQVRVISPHVGGGFGSKGTPRPHVILAVMAAQALGRPVKLAVTRQQMFALTGYRTPTIQRMRLGADREGRLTAICHDAIVQTSTIREFAEQAAQPTRMMYSGPNRRTTHQVARLDVPTPSWMRAPGETPGMYAVESAMDELAIACGIDPIELRVRNDPEVDPETGHRFSSRNLVACLREGAERFEWNARDPRPGVGRVGRWLIGTGLAASTYPARRQPSSAHASYEPGSGYTIQIAAADIGTGARTALTQIAADALEVPVEEVEVQIGDSSFPEAFLAGGSMGNASWGSAVVKACRELRARMAEEGSEVPLWVEADTKDEVAAASAEPLAKHGFGAQFIEARVDVDTGEVHVPRALGVFAVGRVINPKTARSQFIGGMTMGIGMALHEESVLDLEFGDYLNHDLAGYHVPANPDIEQLEAIWLEEDDPHVNPMGAKGIGEIGIVGTAAAVANAVHHATGVRVRDLPIRPDKLIGALPRGNR